MLKSPAAKLEGTDLKNGWTVQEKIDLKDSTGGYFSISYEVLSDSGEKAFLKALDFSKPPENGQDELEHFESLIKSFNFERELLEKCKNKRMSRVVTPIAHGNVEMEGFIRPWNKVYYIIFKLAESDIRNFIAEMKKFDLAWTLRSLHHTAVGLSQLHTHDIAHQDLKPSNVLYFTKEGSKVADLGCAADKGKSSENDNGHPGDQFHAPPESFYPGFNRPGFEFKKMCDLYLLGSLIFFHFSQISATEALSNKLKGFSGIQWGDNFDVELPYWDKAFADAIADLNVDVRDKAGDLSSEIIQMTKQLCNPNPSKRGDLKWERTAVPVYNLERIISKLDFLSKKAESSFNAK